MYELFRSPEFWLGAVLLCAFQIGKFGELNATDDYLKDRSTVVPNLRASDFIGQKPYIGTLLLFLFATVAGYLLLCLASPALIAGWVRVTTDTTDAEKITQLVQSVPYPLYISAAFMGLAHQGIYGFSNIANLQRDIFHDLVGVPRIVVATSDHFASQILTQSPTKVQLAEHLKQLTGDKWRDEIEPYADVRFYKGELSRLKLDTDTLDEALGGSPRELRTLVEQLVYVAAIATVRKSGGRALAKLAKDLGVSMPERTGLPLSGLLAGALWSVVGLTVLWFSIPMAAPLIHSTIGSLEFWPNGDGALYTSGIYILSQVVPVLISVIIMLMFLPSTGEIDQQTAVDTKFFESNSSCAISIIVAVVIFDYLQILSDYGINNFKFDGTTGHFFASWLPYNILHSFISVCISLIILHQITRREILDSSNFGVFIDWVKLAIITAIISTFYAESRLYLQYKEPAAVNYLIIVVMLNVAAATIAMVASRSICRRRLAKAAQVASLRQMPTAVAV